MDCLTLLEIAPLWSRIVPFECSDYFLNFYRCHVCRDMVVVIALPLPAKLM